MTAETLSDEALWNEVRDFLYREADLLDEKRLREWLELVTEDVDYRIPIRSTRERNSSTSEFSDASYHMKETYDTLEARIERLSHQDAHSENPPSRNRRIVGNIRITERDGDRVREENNLLLCFGTRDEPQPLLISARRRDDLRWDDGQFKLAGRLVWLDSTVLGDRLSVVL